MTECSACEKEILESQVKALTDLIEVARAVVSTLDLDTVLQAILTSAMNFAGTPAGTVAVYEEEKQEFVLHSYVGLSARFAKIERWRVTPGGAAEKLLAEGDTCYIEDVSQATFLDDPLLVAEGIRSLICIPLKVPAGVVGLLHLGDFAPRQFDREKMKLLSILSSFAAMAIDNAKLHNRTKIMAITDSLTGLNNYRYFQEVFGQELRRAERYQRQLAVLMFDVDDFKKFNDHYGHPVGDRVLAAIGTAIARTVRQVDYAFRYGGEEFIVLLPETGLENALLAAERLRMAIARETAATLQGVTAAGVTVSVGVACYPDNGADQDELFTVVDGLLYKAKELGKNKIYHVKKESEA
jgi:diguanylate cyclase (GGDEF)-like protein